MIATAFTMLFAKVSAVLTWIGLLWQTIFHAIWDVVKDAWSWPFDQVMSVAVSAIGAIDLSGINSSLQGWGGVPAEMMNLLSLLGVGTAMTIIGSAILIRFALQLIPFVRLGS